MALFGQAKEDDVSTLIAKKKYSKAIELIKEQLKTQRPDPRLRLQLADVLILAGKGKEAVMVLMPVADEFAREGFAAKAISVLKKIQKIDPGRRDVDSRLASLIQEKQRQATVTAPPPSSGGFEIGMEEIGFEAAAPIAVPARAPSFEPALEVPRSVVPEPPARPAAPTMPAPVEDRDLFADGEDSLPPEAFDLEPVVEPAAAAAPIVVEPELAPLEVDPLPLELEALPLAPVDGELVLESDPIVDAEPESADPMSDAAFASELLSVIDTAFQDLPGDGGVFTDPVGNEPTSGAQIVVSPLFKDFSVDELVAVIQGLKLLTFERSQMIIRQGDPGDSLYMLTAGTVRAFIKGPDGKQVKVGDLEEGAFFGEVSILTGKPRSASIVATEHCELLELDRATLDSITSSHPHVMDVMREFAEQRTKRKS
jgi:CRP-like cAMP-binding protein